MLGDVGAWARCVPGEVLGCLSLESLLRELVSIICVTLLLKLQILVPSSSDVTNNSLDSLEYIQILDQAI